MTRAVVLGGAWGVLVVGAVLHRPRPPRRIRALWPTRPRAVVTRSPSITAVVALVGHVLLGAIGRRTARRDVAARVGAAALVSVVAAVVWPAAIVVGAVAAWAVPIVGARRHQRAREGAVLESLPDVVDLVASAVGAGLNVRLAVAAAARHAPGPIADELGRVGAAVARGHRLADALEELPARLGEPVRPLVAALVASDRYGAPLAVGLERLADDVRRTRRRRAEEAARRIPVKLLFPLVLGTLPAFALLTVAPLVAGALRLLRP